LPASIVCLFHAAFLTFSAFELLLHPDVFYGKVCKSVMPIWLVLIILWLFWPVLLWIIDGRSRRRIFIPIVWGLLILSPAVLVYSLLWGIGHSTGWHV
jgi:hypothetical protein